MSNRCEICGTALLGMGDQITCPVCLLKTALEPSASEQALATIDPEETQAREWSTAVALPPGSEFGNYRIVRQIGRGGMGTVYEANQLATGRRVALKLLSKSPDNPEAKARFLREGRLAAAVNHPNSVYVFGTEQIGRTPAICMEFVSGGTLYDRVKEAGTLSVEDAVNAILQVIAGLEAAEAKGVLHRDVKPSNCFVDAKGQVKVGDFGLSISTASREKSAVTDVTIEGQFIGTPAFSSPEQLRGESLDARSDIYSVGATLFYLLTGKTPFASDNMVHLLATVLDTDPPLISAARPDVPAELSNVVAKCLAKSPGQRFASYREFRQALAPFSTVHAPQPGFIGQRLLAGFADTACIWILFDMARLLLQRLGYALPYPTGLAVAIAYFAIAEANFSGGVGKQLFGLRVTRNGAPPNILRCFFRAAIYEIPPYCIVLTPFLFQAQTMVSPYVLFAVVRALTYLPAKSANGFAGFHELLTGTRVVSAAKEPASTSKTDVESFQELEKKRKIGPYHLLQLLPIYEGAEEHGLWLGYDEKLMRRVWIHERRISDLPTGAEVRQLGRPTRLRWLGGQRSDEASWDCYEATQGQPLTLEIIQKLPWIVRRQLWSELGEELIAATEDGSLPAELSMSHVWITHDQHLKLLPFVVSSHGDVDVPTCSHGSLAADQPAEEAARQFFHCMGELLLNDGPELLSEETLLRVPFSARASLQTTSEANSLKKAVQQIAHTPSSTTSCWLRRITLVGIYAAIPLIFALMTVGNWIEWQWMDRAHPEINKLGVEAIVVAIMSEEESVAEDIQEAKSHIAHQYRHVVQNPALWNSVYTRSRLHGPSRQVVEQIMDRTSDAQPTAEQAEKTKAAMDRVTDAYEESRDGTVIRTTVTTESPLRSIGRNAPLILFAFWVSSLLSACLFERGALLRMCSLQLVDENGRPATKWLAIRRILIQGIFVVPAFVLYGICGPSITGNVLILPLVIVCAISLWHPKRNLSDRIAGTYLIPA